ncbi:MAG: hypothetical protein ACOQNV_00865 [Mycoplasmoidaceae bacterium]
MAKPLAKINKTTFLNNYNIVEVSNDIKIIMKSLEAFNPEEQVVAIGIRKQPRDTTPAWFKTYEAKMNAALKSIIFEMRNGFKQINSRIDNLVAMNNLKE